jgi:lipoprotein NlpD
MQELVKNVQQYRWLSLALVVLCVACSATKPAPIKDQTTSVSKRPTVVIPNWSVTNASEPFPAKPEPAPKPKPFEESKPAPVKSQPKVIENNPPPVQDAIIPDPSFRIGKPSTAPIFDGYNGNSNKGIDFGGKIGDPVLAAADGKVIFSGNSLRSYGNLVIVKHTNSYISIYAHNNKNLVKEGDTVKRGQKIAEMGNSEADRVKLHFELRRDSKPIDPTGYFDN